MQDRASELPRIFLPRLSEKSLVEPRVVYPVATQGGEMAFVGSILMPAETL